MNKKRTLLIFAVSALAAAKPVWAQDTASAQAAFYHANEAYKRGRFQEAVEGYKTILDSGSENGAVYYNLGNALLKSGKKGEAYWAYLKAARYAPSDPDVHANLNYARSILPNSESVSVKAPKIIQLLTADGAWPTRQLFLAAVLLVWLSVMCRLIFSWLPSAQRAALPVGWLLAISALLAATALSLQTLWVDHAARAVITQDNAEVRFAPQETGTVHFSLPEGAVVRLLQKDRGWAQVCRGDGRTGWIEEQALKPL